MPNILIIEDNHMHYELAAELLIQKGYNVLEAENATEGIKLAQKNLPDLILMDMDLPEKDGYCATTELKNNSSTKHIPIIALTALVMNHQVEKAFSSGCSGFISKPIEVATFANTVSEYMPEELRDNSHKSIKIDYEDITNYQITPNKEQKPKVLIVDDNPINVELLRGAIEQIGASVKVEYSGKSALNTLKDYPVDLILLDIMMPEMNGYEVLEEIKNIPYCKNTPVVFISALNETKDIVKGLDLGSYGYITKPYNIDEVKARVQSVIRIKELQDKLRIENEKFDLINKYSADGIVLLDSNSNIVSCNDKFSKWFNKDNKDFIGLNFCKLIECNNYKKADCCLNLNPNGSMITKELFLKSEHKNIYVEINSSTVHDSNNQTNGFILIIRDVTVHKEIEKQKETFIATLTHDLKTPIRAEIRSLEMLLQDKFGAITDTQREIIQETLNSSQFMFKMVDTLLTGYKYDNGKIQLHKENININELLKTSINEIMPLIEEKKQTLNLNINDEQMFISADAMEIKRLISNLLSNANNYTQEGGNIDVVTLCNKDKVQVSIQDNGRGITQEQKKTLFEKYTSHSKKFRQVGTGLGLYISKHIAEAHGGKIYVESQDGLGSTFTFEIPTTSILV